MSWLSRLIYISALLAISAGTFCAAKQTKIVSNGFSPYVWQGKGPDSKTDMMLITSLSGDVSNGKLQDVVLHVFERGKETDDAPVRVGQWRGASALMVSQMKVYRDPKRHVLYAVIYRAGADTGGTIVVSVDKSGKTRTLFDELNFGYPEFRMQNGVPEVKEVWEIGQLEHYKQWKPTKEFDSHALVERIYRLGTDSKFHLQITRPAIADEKKLSQKEFQRIQKRLPPE